WLHLARGVLELPELDRLFGEMNKLAQLAETDISDEVLEARVQQALTVFQSRAWKTLLRL
ncbi:MAG: inorganic triphosphatase, partial [Pseudomonas sp.]